MKDYLKYALEDEYYLAQCKDNDLDPTDEENWDDYVRAVESGAHDSYREDFHSDC